MLHSYYLKAFRHHGQKAVKQLCEKEIHEEINGAIMSFNRSFNVHYVEHKVQMPKTIKRKRY